jgi:trans-aconitate methyltransferase
LHIVYLYTNLVFTDKQKENEPKLYDALKSNGFIDAVLEVMDEAEYNELFAWIEEIRNDSLKYKTSAAALLKGVIEDLPKNAQIAADVVNNFDPEKYKAVTDFANHANGDRPFNTKP